jgi:hypothetical protein
MSRGISLIFMEGLLHNKCSDVYLQKVCAIPSILVPRPGIPNGEMNMTIPPQSTGYLDDNPEWHHWECLALTMLTSTSLLKQVYYREGFQQKAFSQVCKLQCSILLRMGEWCMQWFSFVVAWLCMVLPCLNCRSMHG